MMPRLAYDKHRQWTVRVVRIEREVDEDGPYEVAHVVRVGNTPPGVYAPDIAPGDQYRTCPSFLVPLTADL